VSQKYVVYGNPVVWASQELSDVEELQALRAALALGQMLERVVILPRFHCNMSVGGRGRGGSHAPARTAGECPLNCLLNMIAFDAQFQRAYRESSFLRHPLVPPSVRDDRSSTHDIHRRLKSSDDDDDDDDATARNYSQLLPSTAVQLSADETVRLFGGSSAGHVLVFHALYRVDPRFAGADEQRTFDERVRKAFRRGTYRQL